MLDHGCDSGDQTQEEHRLLDEYLDRGILPNGAAGFGDPRACTCTPCTSPGYGAPGYDHCAACCALTFIVEYDPHCPDPDHRALARRQFPPVTTPAAVGFDDDPPF